MKLNLGCGPNKIDGFVNIDKSPACDPDRVIDLEELPWPFASDSVSEVAMIHVLEHLGADTDTFLGIMKELYRVCRPGAPITIVVPHPRHDNFLGDPTHVRPILPETLQLFSRARNEEWRHMDASNTPLAFYLDVDFELTSVDMQLDKAWSDLAQAEQFDENLMNETIRRYNNVVNQVTCKLKAVKD